MHGPPLGRPPSSPAPPQQRGASPTVRGRRVSFRRVRMDPTGQGRAGTPLHGTPPVMGAVPPTLSPTAGGIPSRGGIHLFASQWCSKTCSHDALQSPQKVSSASESLRPLQKDKGTLPQGLHGGAGRFGSGRGTGTGVHPNARRGGEQVDPSRLRPVFATAVLQVLCRPAGTRCGKHGPG